MQQSLTYQVLASTITNGAGNPINPDSNGVYNIYPDAYHGNVGYRVFDQLKLDQGDIMNFIYQWLSYQENGYGNATDINTFVNLVNSQVEVNGIVNALANQAGSLKNNGNLIFISPNGMVVGATGVLNVGSLSVLTPTNESYEALRAGLPLEVEQNNNHSIAIETSEHDLSTLVIDNQPITINGRVVARGNIDLQGGMINIGDGAKVYAGISNSTFDSMTYPKDSTASNIETIFDALVNTDNMTSGNGFAASNGNIVITSKGGTSVGNNALVRNYASSGDITITNTGASGVKIAGEVSNPNGNLTVTNSAGELLVANTGVVKNNGKMAMQNSGNGTGITIAGNVNNKTGAAAFTNTSTGGKLLVESTGKITSEGSTLMVNNSGSGGMDIQGTVINTNSDATVTFNNANSDMKIGNAAVDKNIQSNADVKITVQNGSLLNNGVNKTLIATTEGAGLNAIVTNGSIGTDLGNQDGNYTGIWQAQRDLEKSLNIAVDGNVTAISTGTNSSANIASINKNLNVDRISSEGRTTVLADSSTSGNTAYNIVNASTDNSQPNIEGKGVSIIASGKIGDTNKALTFRQTGGSYGSVDGQLNYTDNASYGTDMLAIGDINVKGMDASNGNKLDTNVGALISREGNVNAEFSGDTYVRETTADGTVNITTRGKNLYVEHLGEAPSYNTYTEDYFGPNNNAHPTSAKLTALDLGTSWPSNPPYG